MWGNLKHRVSALTLFAALSALGCDEPDKKRISDSETRFGSNIKDLSSNLSAPIELEIQVWQESQTKREQLAASFAHSILVSPSGEPIDYEFASSSDEFPGRITFSVPTLGQPGWYEFIVPGDVTGEFDHDAFRDLDGRHSIRFAIGPAPVIAALEICPGDDSRDTIVLRFSERVHLEGGARLSTVLQLSEESGNPLFCSEPAEGQASDGQRILTIENGDPLYEWRLLCSRPGSTFSFKLAQVLGESDLPVRTYASEEVNTTISPDELAQAGDCEIFKFR